MSEYEARNEFNSIISGGKTYITTRISDDLQLFACFFARDMSDQFAEKLKMLQSYNDPFLFKIIEIF